MGKSIPVFMISFVAAEVVLSQLADNELQFVRNEKDLFQDKES